MTALVLDLGGVLEDTPATGWEQAWERRLGLEVVGHVAAKLDLDPAGSEALWEDLWAEYLGTLNDRLLDYASRLRPAFKVGLWSSVDAARALGMTGILFTTEDATITALDEVLHGRP